MKRTCPAILTALAAAWLLGLGALPGSAETWLGMASPGSPPRLPADGSTPHRNDCAIVLVHGYAGFGQDGPLGLNNWGGRQDLCVALRERGYETRAVAIGPLSSNWDRACELFAAIRGGRVDYGEAHARSAGHARFGGEYRGFMPDWGEARRVHLVGHSMGGQTCRVLVHLLEEGSAQERTVSPASELSPLFAGGKSGEAAWVVSVTTLSAPHDGTPMAYFFSAPRRRTRSLCSWLYWQAAPSRRQGICTTFGLDLHLEAWGLAPAPGESCGHFRRRFVAAGTWWRSRDTGAWDASPQGARELNLWVPASPGVYYFSWAAEQTTRNPLDGRYVPEPCLTPFFYSMSAFLGSWGSDPAWWPNDGAVPTCSMDGPAAGSEDRIEPFAGQPRKGVWNFMGVLDSFDHLDLLGLPSAREAPAGYASLIEWYVSIAQMLAGLPP